MYPRVAQGSTLRIAIALTICAALLPLSSIASLVSEAAQGQSQDRKGRPRPGRPEGDLPDLNEIRHQPQIDHEAPPPIPSTMRSKRNEGKPWDGRRVGDPPLQGVLRAHARTRMTPRPLPDNQFVQNFFTWALLRNPLINETTYWYDQLRVAYGQGQTSLKLAAIELGKTLFESADYAGRNRDAHGYVYDLYKSYLMRDPDSGGWATWEGLVSSHGREYVRRGFEESGEFATLIATIVPNGSPSSNAASLITARVDPRNQPGNGMLTRDATWSLPLLSLPGRAGLDLGLVLSYSSQVWTRSDPYIYFDEDNGSPSPGFRLGFPTVQRKAFDAQTARNAYLFITGSGHRVELRQVGTSNIYDATDSSYLRLTENGATLLVYSTDGMKLSFSEINGEYRCVEIKDRNGNYITVSYNTLGQIANITDTLSRVITFNYDVYHNLLSITQPWGAQTHQWATFGWTSHTMHPSTGTLKVVGTADGSVLPLLMQVGLPDGSHYNFEYTNAAQVSVIRRYRADNTQPFYTIYQYEATTTDCPRLSQVRVAAENWTSVNGVPAEVTTYFAVDPDGACRMTAPDNTVYKEYYGTGWQKGLTTLSEVWVGVDKLKWTTTAWTQDNTGVSYETNPRVTETNVYDKSGNRRRTVIDYGNYAQWGLPYLVKDYAADGTTEIRHTFYDYNLSQEYLDRRIIGLVSAIHQTDVVSWQRKISFSYDDPARLQALPAATTQHDTAYSSSFTARGNVTAVSRWDVTDIVNPAKALTSYTNYYTTGTPKSMTDAVGHPSSITYDDSFSDNVNRNTFAYPTTLTDPDGFSSTVKYNFNFGGQTRMQGPPPAGQSQGAIQSITYDSLGRIERTTTENNGAYTRYVYGPNYVQSFSTVNNIADEAYDIQVFDGVGRMYASAANHPGSTGGYSAQMYIYDLMGRPIKTSNPAEITNAWVPAGDDATGWLYTQQTYDWKGRPLRTTHPDTTYKEAAYSGCGCAGGEVVTLIDEGTISDGVAKRRQQNIYSDVLGRTVKTEVLYWQGSATVYSTTVNIYNARDQVTQVRQYAGAEGSGTYQDTTMTYDGYGRLKTTHDPKQNAGTATTLVYNADDTIQTVTDARGATSTFTYNNARHLPNTVTHTLSGSSTIVETFAYDAAGNRTSTAHGGGSTSYQYDQLSRLTSETHHFNGLANSFLLTYQYNLAGQLTTLTYPGFNTSYTYDTTGRTKSVSGPPRWTGVTQYVSDIQYRASGSYKTISYGSGTSLSLDYNARLQLQSYKIRGFANNQWYDAAHVEAQYFADGSVRTTQDFYDPRFNRSYFFDHAGSLRQSYSSVYNQTFQYDGFGNITNRQSAIWSQFDTFTASWINGRNQNPTWQYDANGNVRFDDDFEYTYDAKGLNSKVRDISNNQWISQTANAEGLMTKRSTGDATSTFTTTYYLRSTVLDGKVVAEYNAAGQQQKRYAYLDGHLLATESTDSNSFNLEHINPLTGSRGKSFLSGSSGIYYATAEPDYSGLVDVGFSDPNDVPPLPPAEPDIVSLLPGPNSQCRVEGIQTEFGCYLALRLLAGKTALRCPNDDCDAHTMTVTHTIGGDVAAVSRFLVTAGEPGWDGSLDGTYGWLPPLSNTIDLGDPNQAKNVVRQIPELVKNEFMTIVELQKRQNATPQVIPIGDLKARIQSRLDFRDCAVYVNRLIAKVGELNPGNPASAADVMGLYEQIDTQPNGGFVGVRHLKVLDPTTGIRHPVSGLTQGARARGDALVSISFVESYGTSNIYNLRHAAITYGITALHEIIHQSGSKGYYTDYQLAIAAKALNRKVTWSPITDGSINSMVRNSGYWDSELKEHCVPKSNR